MITCYQIMQISCIKFIPFLFCLSQGSHLPLYRISCPLQSPSPQSSLYISTHSNTLQYNSDTLQKRGKLIKTRPLLSWRQLVAISDLKEAPTSHLTATQRVLLPDVRGCQFKRDHVLGFSCHLKGIAELNMFSRQL